MSNGEKSQIQQVLERKNIFGLHHKVEKYLPITFKTLYRWRDGENIPYKSIAVALYNATRKEDVDPEVKELAEAVYTQVCGKTG